MKQYEAQAVVRCLDAVAAGPVSTRSYPGHPDVARVLRTAETAFPDFRIDTAQLDGVQVLLFAGKRQCLAVWFVPGADQLLVGMRSNTKWSELGSVTVGTSGALVMDRLSRTAGVASPWQLPALAAWFLLRGLPRAAGGFVLEARVWAWLNRSLHENPQALDGRP